MKVDFLKVNGFRVANIKVDSGIAAFGIGVLAGSRYETPEIAGIAHFAEHMFFKGSKNISWEEQDRMFAKAGANQNAYTGNDLVLYFANFPEENCEKVVYIIMDMFFNATFPKDEMEKERTVIMEEKRRAMDDPHQFFMSQIGADFFQWWLGHDTLGTMETIESIQREDIVRFLNERCNVDSVMFFYVGNAKNEDVLQLIGRNIPKDHSYIKKAEFASPSLASGLWNPEMLVRKDKIKLYIEKEDSVQSHIHMSIAGLPVAHSKRFASRILMNVIGGGMYSMLFSRIRQELGLSYSVWMGGYDISYPDYQVLMLHGGTAKSNVNQFIDESELILAKVLRDGIEPDLFECGKADLLASYMRSNETAMGKLMFFDNMYMADIRLTLDDLLESIRTTTIDDCNAIAKILLNVPHNWAVMSPND